MHGMHWDNLPGASHGIVPKGIRASLKDKVKIKKNLYIINITNLENRLAIQSVLLRLVERPT